MCTCFIINYIAKFEDVLVWCWKHFIFLHNQFCETSITSNLEALIFFRAAALTSLGDLFEWCQGNQLYNCRCCKIHTVSTNCRSPTSIPDWNLWYTHRLSDFLCHREPKGTESFSVTHPSFFLIPPHQSSSCTESWYSPGIATFNNTEGKKHSTVFYIMFFLGFQYIPHVFFGFQYIPHAFT